MIQFNPYFGTHCHIMGKVTRGGGTDETGERWCRNLLEFNPYFGTHCHIMGKVTHQKAFNVYLVGTSYLAYGVQVWPIPLCSIKYIMKQKSASMPSLAHSDALTIQRNLWNYKAKCALRS
jgi:hypothetical protein